MNNETWKPIPGFPGYEASDLGHVRSYKRKVTGPGTRGQWEIAATPQRILSPYHGRYAFVHLTKNGICYSFKVHQLIMLAFHGSPPDGMEVCHNDSDPTNNCLENLRYDTHKDNMADRDLGSYCRKISESTVVALRKARAAGASCSKISSQFGIDKHQVSSICSGNSRKHDDGPITNSHFNADEILEILDRRSRGETLESIASDFGRDKSCISLICRGKRGASILKRAGVTDKASVYLHTC